MKEFGIENQFTEHYTPLIMKCLNILKSGEDFEHEEMYIYSLIVMFHYLRQATDIDMFILLKLLPECRDNAPYLLRAYMGLMKFKGN